MIPVSQEKYNQLQKAAQKTEVLERLVIAQKKYRVFIGERYNSAFIAAYIHRYGESEEDIATGVKLRDEIERLEQEVKRQ